MTARRHRLLAITVACTVLTLTYALSGPWRAQTTRATLRGRAQPRKPRAYLHIGPHKTGTSFIQAMLCAKEADLARAGIVIPTPPPCGSVNPCDPKHFISVVHQLLNEHGDEQPRHRKTIVRTCGADPVQGLASALAATNGSDVVISSEGFDMLGDQSVAALARLLSEKFDAYIVIVQRDKLAHLLSYYAQWNKFATPPLTFQDFYWMYVSDADAGAVPDARPVVVEGLFLSRLVRTYGRYFGMDKFIVINYDAAGDRLWDVFVDSVLGVPGLKTNSAQRRRSGDAASSGSTPPASLNNTPAASLDNTPAANPPVRVNVSPSATALTVTARYYAARWGVHGYGVPVFNRHSRSAELPPPPAGMPTIDCVAPLIQTVVDRLPQACTSVDNIVRPWEREERGTLARLAASGSKLVMFDAPGRDAAAAVARTPGGGVKSATKVCDVDFEAVMARANLTRPADALLWALQDVSDRIDLECAA